MFPRRKTKRGRTIAIGDIHGCSSALAAIIERIDPQPSDLIVTLGDHIDRGPDSRGVIDQLLALSKRTLLAPLLGNHEIMFLESIERGELAELVWRECGGATTIDSYGGLSNIPDDHIDFLRECLPYYETSRQIFVHANFDPESDMNDQPDFLMFWEHLTNFTPRRHKSGKRVFVGHTPQASGEILDLDHTVCIDTWCYGDGWLTALDVDTSQVWQADREGRMRANGGSGS